MSSPTATPKPRTNCSALMNTKLSESSLPQGCAPEPAWPSADATPTPVSTRPAMTMSQATIFTCSLGARLRLALCRTALEGLERAQLVPRLLGRLGRGEAEPPGIGLDDPLADADVDRAALHAGRSALAPEAQVAFREGVRDHVVGE